MGVPSHSERVVAGSSPAVVHDVAQREERQCPLPPGSQADPITSGQLRRTGFLRERACGSHRRRRSTRHRSSTEFPDRTHQRERKREEGVMPKFSGTKRRPRRANPTAFVRTTNQPTLTHEGGEALVRDVESELFLLAATNMVGEDTFYERAGTRNARFRDLVHAAAATNPAFIAGADPDNGEVGLAQYLRETMLMRS